MICGNCGAEISDNASFCDYCGAKAEKVVNVPSSQPNGDNTVFCPKCQSRNLQVIVETNTKGGGFGAGKSCIGYLVLGPLGLLCGACGSKVKTTNKTFFTCMNCGNKFRESKDMIEEITSEMRYSIISAVVTGFLAIASYNQEVIPLAVFFLLCSIGSIMGYVESKKSRTEIETRGYDAEWYKNPKKS